MTDERSESPQPGWTPPPPPGQTGWTPPPPPGYGQWQQGPGQGQWQPGQGQWQPGQGQWQPGQTWNAGWQPPPRRGLSTAKVIVIVVVSLIVSAVLGAVFLFAIGLGSLAGTPIKDLAVGQCFNGGRASETRPDMSIVFGVEVVECAEPHTSELIATFDYPDATGTQEYPGDDVVVGRAEAGCLSQFRDYVGVGYDQSELELTYVYPLRRNWVAGDRSVQCVVHPRVGQETSTGSVRDSRR